MGPSAATTTRSPGVSVSIAPTKNIYLRYGFYDGNVARGEQTGLLGPQFNGYYFNVWEGGVDWVVAENYPGQFGTGLWYQTGALEGPNAISQKGTGGFYMFGGQRIWEKRPEIIPTARKAANGGIVAQVQRTNQTASISTFFQFGVNNSETLPVNQYFGVGFTGFGLVPCRPDDSMGVGMSWAWLDLHVLPRPSELMLQGYYRAHLLDGVFFQPTVTYIPTPGASAELGGASALTLRLTMLL